MSDNFIHPNFIVMHIDDHYMCKLHLNLGIILKEIIISSKGLREGINIPNKG